ncbi:MAG: serine/threonine protein kinase [Candidatus Paceibacteria bacterium]|jgi:serine/threonine protein kinase
MDLASKADQDVELDALVFAYLERREEGASHDSTLDQLLADHPHREDDLRDSLDALRSAGLLKPEVDVEENFPEELGGYTLKRRLGSGGMGVVFLAENTKGEVVALKLIRPEQLYFDRARARFQRELDSAALLKHPGIVGVLGSGEEHGIPFLVQDWIPGASLDTLLRGLTTRVPEELSSSDMAAALKSALPPEMGSPTPDEQAFGGSYEDTVLRIVAQVARALEHAHSNGVLHRDVKPSNIMLTAQGQAILVDFGLATVPEAHRWTRTGAQPGSLPYMAPEQIEGSSRDLDARTDIYGLGVTLFELLTLQKPFRSQSAVQLRSLILDANPDPPRRFHPLLSKEVETLCLKAMDRDPRQRYRSAAEFAEDIERQLARKQIQARPIGVALRMLRWARRRPAQAAALLLITVGPIGWALVTQWAMTQVQAAYQVEQEARASADRHLELTLDAIRRLLRGMANDSFARTPHMQRTRLEAIELAQEMVGELEKERPNDLVVREELGHIMRFKGDVLGDIGRFEEARASYKAQVQIFSDLMAIGPSQLRPLYKREMSLGNERYAALNTLSGPTPEVLEEYESALQLLREVAAENMVDGAGKAQLTVGLKIYAILLLDAGRLEEALAIAEEGVDLTSSLLEENPANAKFNQNAANIRSARLLITASLGPVDTDLAESKLILKLSTRAAALDPEDPRIRENLIEHTRSYSLGLTRLGQIDEALKHSQAALEQVRVLAAQFPSIERFSALLFGSLVDHASNLMQAGKLSEAITCTQVQAELAEEDFRVQPRQFGTAQRAALGLANWASVLLSSTQGADQALELLQRGDKALEIAREVDPGHATLPTIASSIAYSRALALLFLDQREEAESAIEAHEALMEDNPRRMVFNADLWAEWVQCVKRTQPLALDLVIDGRERCFESLEFAIGEGFDDLSLLRESAAFVAVLAADPRWNELLAELGG